MKDKDIQGVPSPLITLKASSPAHELVDVLMALREMRECLEEWEMARMPSEGTTEENIGRAILEYQERVEAWYKRWTTGSLTHARNN